MLATLIDLVSGWWGPTDPESQLAKDARRRANAAYAAAWKTRAGTHPHDVAPLVRELRARNVPGSFANDPADPLVAFYLESWRAAKDPKAVRAESISRSGDDRDGRG